MVNINLIDVISVNGNVFCFINKCLTFFDNRHVKVFEIRSLGSVFYNAIRAKTKVFFLIAISVSRENEVNRKPLDSFFVEKFNNLHFEYIITKVIILYIFSLNMNQFFEDIKLMQ